MYIPTNISKFDVIKVKDAIETEILTKNNVIYNYSIIPTITVFCDDTCFLGSEFDIKWDINASDRDSLNDNDRIDILYINSSGDEILITDIDAPIDPNMSVYTWNNTLNTSGHYIKFKVRYSEYNEVFGISNDVFIRNVPDYTLYNLIQLVNEEGKAKSYIDKNISLYKNTDFILKWNTMDLVTIEYSIGYSSMFYPLSSVTGAIDNKCSIVVPGINSNNIKIKIYNTKYPKYQYISDLVELKEKVLKIENDFTNLQLIGTYAYAINIYTEAIKAVKVMYSIDSENWVTINSNLIITNSIETVEWTIIDIDNEFTFIKVVEINNESNYVISDSFKILKQGVVKFIYPFFEKTNLIINHENSVLFYACDVKNINLEFNSEPYMMGTWDSIYSGSIISDRITESNLDFCYHIHYEIDSQLSEKYRLRLTNTDTGQTSISSTFRTINNDDFNSDNATLIFYLATDIGTDNNIFYKLSYKNHSNESITVRTGSIESLSTGSQLISFENLYSYNYILSLQPTDIKYTSISYEVGKPKVNLNNIFTLNRRKKDLFIISTNLLNYNDPFIKFKYNLINEELGVTLYDLELNSYNAFTTRAVNQFWGEWKIKQLPIVGTDIYSYRISNTSLIIDSISPSYDVNMIIEYYSHIIVHGNPQFNIKWKLYCKTFDGLGLLTPQTIYLEDGTSYIDYGTQYQISLNGEVGDTTIYLSEFIDLLPHNEFFDFRIEFEYDHRFIDGITINSPISNRTNVIPVSNGFEFKVNRHTPIVNLEFTLSTNTGWIIQPPDINLPEDMGQVNIVFDTELDQYGSISILKFIRDDGTVWINYPRDIFSPSSTYNNDSFYLPIGNWTIIYGSYRDSNNHIQNVSVENESYNVYTPTDSNNKPYDYIDGALNRIDKTAIVHTTVAIIKFKKRVAN